MFWIPSGLFPAAKWGLDQLKDEEDKIGYSGVHKTKHVSQEPEIDRGELHNRLQQKAERLEKIADGIKPSNWLNRLRRRWLYKKAGSCYYKARNVIIGSLRIKKHQMYDISPACHDIERVLIKAGLGRKLVKGYRATIRWYNKWYRKHRGYKERPSDRTRMEGVFNKLQEKIKAYEMNQPWEDIRTYAWFSL